MAEEFLRVKQYRINNEFFEKGFKNGQSPCSCTSHCCRGGVWVDVQEYEAIIEQRELIRNEMDETQNPDPESWFEPGVFDDADFPSGKCVGTSVINNKCAFLDKSGRCAIQLAAVTAGKHRWAWKPLYCILYPVEVSDGVIGFDTMLQGEQPCCSASAEYDTPLFAACRDELTHLLGEDGYALLERHYAMLNTTSAETRGNFP